MVKLGICFCKKGIMSECDPAGNKQFMCDFFERHTYANRCTHHNPDMNDHCWSADAQAFGYQPTKPAQVAEANYCSEAEVDEMLSEAPYVQPTVVQPTLATGAKRETCEHCANHPGCPLTPIEAFKLGKNLSNLTPQDYWVIGSACISWCSAMP